LEIKISGRKLGYGTGILAFVLWWSCGVTGRIGLSSLGGEPVQFDGAAGTRGLGHESENPFKGVHRFGRRQKVFQHALKADGEEIVVEGGAVY